MREQGSLPGEKDSNKPDDWELEACGLRSTSAPTQMRPHCDCDGVRHSQDHCLPCPNTETNKNPGQTTK